MSQFTSAKRAEKIEELNKNYENLKNIAKSAKVNIYEEKQQRRESRLRLKFSKLDIRMKKGVIFKQLLGDIKASWVTFALFFATFHLLKNQLFWRKIRIKKCRQIWKKTRVFFQAFFRFRRIMVGSRKAVRLAEVYQKAANFSKVLIVQRKTIRNLVVSVIEKHLTRSVVVSLVQKHSQKAVLIQRSVRSFLSYRKEVYSALLFNWKLAESSPLSLPKKSIKPKLNFLSDESRLLHIRSYVKMKVKDYLLSLSVFITNHLQSSLKPPKPNMLSSVFMSQAASYMRTVSAPKRLSMRKSLYKP